MSVVKYDSENYAETRLRHSVVKTFDNRVVFVEGYNNQDRTFLCRDLMRKLSYTEIKLKDLDMSPLELGFVNHKQESAFITRMPVRHYKQGLTSYTITNMTKAEYTSKELAKCALNIFPKVLDCAELLFCGEVKSIAFSRNFALTYKKRLLFRGKDVGEMHFNPNNGLIHNRLRDETKFLQEMLDAESST